jgi:hypothetical protein
MPDGRLILSTWDDADPRLLDPIRALGVDVVLNPKPAVPGLMNVNMQLASALAGVRRAEAGGAAWVLKTRTDQRMYAPNLPAFLVALATAFPVPRGYRQRHRILALGRGTLKYAFYHVTDQTLFGHVDDMVAYWSAPPRLETAHPPGFRDVFGDICRHKAPESYLATQFLRRVGRELAWTVEDSWAAIADHFCVVDGAMTDFFWPKYTHVLEYDRTYARIDTSTEIDFREWLVLHAARGSKAPMPGLDAIQHLGLREPVPRPAP